MDAPCPYLSHSPQIASSAFIAPSANVIGAVHIDEDSSVWYQAVLRADIQTIRIGKGSNLQDAVVVHLSHSQGVEIGNWVTCGHRALIHACTIEDEVLVGMGAIIMDGSTIGHQTIIGAGALVTQNTHVPPHSLVLGSPAKVVRTLTEKEIKEIRVLAERYIHVSRAFLAKQNESSHGNL